MRLASAIECAIGFWHNTCLPLRMAAIEIGACQWSGVATYTAFRSFSFSRSSRKSRYAVQPLYDPSFRDA